MRRCAAWHRARKLPTTWCRRLVSHRSPCANWCHRSRHFAPGIRPRSCRGSRKGGAYCRTSIKGGPLAVSRPRGRSLRYFRRASSCRALHGLGNRRKRVGGRLASRETARGPPFIEVLQYAPPFLPLPPIRRAGSSDEPEESGPKLRMPTMERRSARRDWRG
jgi:hypothetical protein